MQRCWFDPRRGPLEYTAVRSPRTFERESSHCARSSRWISKVESYSVTVIAGMYIAKTQAVPRPLRPLRYPLGVHFIRL